MDGIESLRLRTKTLLEGVLKLAHMIAAKSPLAVRGTKDTLNYARDQLDKVY